VYNNARLIFHMWINNHPSHLPKTVKNPLISDSGRNYFPKSLEKPYIKLIIRNGIGGRLENDRINPLPALPSTGIPLFWYTSLSEL
jgi:hypothetical protein